MLTRVLVIKIPHSHSYALADGKTSADNRAIVRCLLRKTRRCRRKAREPDVDLGVSYLEAEGDVSVQLARECGCTGRGSHDEVALQADPVYLCPRSLDGLYQIDSGRRFRSRGFNVVVIVCSTGISIISSNSRAKIE